MSDSVKIDISKDPVLLRRFASACDLASVGIMANKGAVEAGGGNLRISDSVGRIPFVVVVAVGESPVAQIADAVRAMMARAESEAFPGTRIISTHPERAPTEGKP